MDLCGFVSKDPATFDIFHALMKGAEIGSSKRKKKSLAGWRTERIFGGIIPSNDVESWLNMVKHIKNDGLMEIFCGDTI